MLTDAQKRIMATLLQKPSTAENLAPQLNLSYGQVMEELKTLMGQKVIEKGEGFPTTYRLVGDVSQKVNQYQEAKAKDPFDLRLRCLIEAEGIEETLVDKALDELSISLKNQPTHFTIYRCDKAIPQANGERFHGFLDVELSIKDFKSIVFLMFNYGPISMEVIKPQKITLEASDLQDALVDMSEWISRYTTFIAEKLKREEIEKFNRQAYQKPPA